MNQRGFSQVILIGIIAVLILAGAGGFLVSREKKRPSSEITVQQEVFSQKIKKGAQLSETRSQNTEAPGLGNLCSGQKECVSFCLNNRGRCENYCKGNKIELCKIIFPPEKNLKDNVGYQKKQEPEIACKSNPNPVFIESFTDDTHIKEISPIGGVFINNPGSPSRSYVTINPGIKEKGSRELVPIYAPVDSVITSLTYANRNYGELGMRPEYRIDLRVSCEVDYVFDHISNIVDDIKKLAPKIPVGDTRTGAYVSIRVKAGQLLGYTDGTWVAGGFDFMVRNTENKENFINPSRWVSHEKYGVCPYDYFVAVLKEKYYGLLQKTRKSDKKASCRTISRDIPGTLSGGWFQGDSTDANGSRLMIATVSTDMVDLVIMRGDQPTVFRDYTNPDVLRPEDVTVGKSVCYYDRDKNLYAYLKLLSNTEMRLTIESGQCPSSFPIEYETWVR